MRAVAARTPWWLRPGRPTGPGCRRRFDRYDGSAAALRDNRAYDANAAHANRDCPAAGRHGNAVPDLAACVAYRRDDAIPDSAARAAAPHGESDRYCCSGTAVSNAGHHRRAIANPAGTRSGDARSALR